jgi:hypothetical protein
MCVDSVLTNETAKPKLNHLETARHCVALFSAVLPIKSRVGKKLTQLTILTRVYTRDVLH